METSEIEPFTPLISATLRLMRLINLHSNNEDLIARVGHRQIHIRVAGQHKCQQELLFDMH